MSIDRYVLIVDEAGARLEVHDAGAWAWGPDVDKLEAEVERYQQREQHFAKALGVTDGGQYRADWDSAITKVLDDLAAARAQADGLAKALRNLVKMNVEHNEAVESVIGRPVNWSDNYLDEARAALAALPPKPTAEDKAWLDDSATDLARVLTEHEGTTPKEADDA